MPKADEGCRAIERHGVLTSASAPCLQRFRESRRPLIRLRHLLPHKSVGEKALDWKGAADDLSPRSIETVALTNLISYVA